MNKLDLVSDDSKYVTIQYNQKQKQKPIESRNNPEVSQNRCKIYLTVNLEMHSRVRIGTRGPWARVIITYSADV